MTKSGLGPNFTVTSSVELWTSTRELRNFRGCHPCNRLRETTTKSGLGPNFTVTSSVVLWTSTRELRNFRRCHPCKVGILGFERRRQSRVLDRPLQLLVQLSCGLRQDNLEIFADAIHASINEQLIQIYNSFFDFSLKYRVGIVGFGRRQQIRGLDRPLLLLVQLCFGLRRENLEIFADTIHASINEQHDRSCLEMSEADGVDVGAFCKRGFIHLQFPEKLEAPEAERHLGSWILE
ncbi:hypothetical protein V1477_007692 [Vespula maculifrons]|uniref:Uncharacterized protein n=1 Tax=Vespula maculifrons TaxID=7453 RepID=A0ABD2CGE7_VESMC